MVEHVEPTHVLLLCVAILGLLASGGWAAEGQPAPSILSSHPRLLVTGDDLPRLQRQVAAYPEEWERVQSAGLRPPSNPGYGDARALTNAALAYVITRDDRYLENSVALAENICRNHKFNQYASPEVVFALALAYDWCYPALTESQRDEIQQAILRVADYLRDEIWRHSDFNNHFVLEKVWPFVYSGLALHGDLADPRVEEYLSTGSDYLHDNLLPAANLMAGSSGGQFEGFGYDSWGYMRPMALVFEAWRTATGEDLFQSCTATKHNALWNVYAARPFDGKPEHFDDAGLEHAWASSNEGTFIYLLARHHRDGHAQWMGDQIERRYDSYMWPIILWRDPDLAPVPPTDLPTARHFDALGWVLMRSSWQPDATFASFQCGPFITGHQHLDNNAFTIHKRSLLAIDPGINAYGERIDDGYRANYYSRSIAHNTITVYDPAETFRGSSWAGEATGGANDGGQFRLGGAERVEEFEPGSRFCVGTIAAYSQGDLYTYAVGDATKSYSADKLSLFRRHFLFLPPDVFVVFDQVVSTNPDFQKTWILHSVDEPAVDGALATIANGDGRLLSLTVLPEDPEIATVGGPGRECWVYGKNWASHERDEWPPAAGAWRVEVSPSGASEEDHFLHVLQTDGNEIAMPGAVSLVREESRVGVRVCAQGRGYVASFSTDAASGHLRITDGESVLLDQELR